MSEEALTFTHDDDVGDDELDLDNESMSSGIDNEDDEDFVLDEDANADADDDNDFALQGYDDYRVATPEHDDDDGVEALAPKRSRPAYHKRSVRAAQRSGRRVTFDADLEDNTILTFDGDDSDNDAGSKKKPRAMTSRLPGTFGRRNRDKGSTLPAYHKKVGADLDSDDELLLEMRDNGYSDRQIADRLAMEGRVRYDTKSIATRVYRLRQAQAQHVDYLLKEGYVEWRVEDDELLMRAYDLADIEIRYEMERLRAWRFRKVSDYIRRLNKTTTFSPEACAERYIALVKGTAVIPQEVDDDPDARKIEQLEYVSKREHERETAIREQEKLDEEKRRLQHEAKEINAKKAAEVAARREAKENERTNRAVMRATKAQLRQQRAVENTRKREERKSQLEANKKRIDREKRTRSRMNDIYGLDKVKIVARHAADPRMSLSRTQIAALCEQRLLDADGSKKDLLDRIQKQDKAYDAIELKDLCSQRKIPPGGNKSVMKYQLALFESRSFDYNDADVDDDGDDDEEIDGDDESVSGLHAGSALDDAILDFADSDDADGMSDFE
ncbi:unnamed protein product [Periconia digitata]|uniref:DUF7626 domain-containing protein n=1 Tax=Periconia digitata TaxID=1303443 RepID=A0A9W4UQY6_9PLEO|nr:unnamed protein product [Periconia digitata]